MSVVGRLERGWSIYAGTRVGPSHPLLICALSMIETKTCASRTSFKVVLNQTPVPDNGGWGKRWRGSYQ